MIKDQQKYLLVRYSTGYVNNCIEEHINLIQSIGFCWFGKVGNVPSHKILQQVFDGEQAFLVLYRKNAAYLGSLAEYALSKPKDGVPTYYDQEGVVPSVYFRLTALEPCDQYLFHNSLVVSTGAYVDDAIFHSRIPFMLCRYVDESKLIPLGINDCRYKRDGFCSCRSCVNYDCLCERPSLCAKQRR